MKVLSNIKIKGEIFSEYSFLTMEARLKADGETASEFMFALPKGSVLSDIKIVNREGRLIRAKVVAVSHASRLSGIKTTAVLRKTRNDTYLLTVYNREDCMVRLSLYAPIGDANGRRLVFPLGICGGGFGVAKHTAEFELTIAGEGVACSSPTHSIAQEECDGGTKIVTGEISADRDFCLKIAGENRENRAIVTGDGIQGEMLCRIYPSDSFFSSKKPYSKILFMFDNTGALLAGSASCAKELLCAMARQCKCGFSVIAMDKAKAVQITDGYERGNARSLNRLFRNLSGVRTEAGSLGNLIRSGEEFAEEGALPVLLTGDRIADASGVKEATLEAFGKRGLWVVSFGATVQNSELDDMAEQCGGKREHFFGNDDAESRAKEILQNMGCSSYNNIALTASCNSGRIIGLPQGKGDGITAYLSYRGEAPKTLELICDGNRESVELQNVKCYKSFSPAKLVYANEVCRDLEEKLAVCDDNKIYKIRQEMENIGVACSALNSETAYVLELEDKPPMAVRTVIENECAYAHSVFEGRASMFYENEDLDDEGRRILRADALLKRVRADGAICTAGELDIELRRKQTRMAVEELLDSGMLAKDNPIIIKALNYIEERG